MSTQTPGGRPCPASHSAFSTQAEPPSLAEGELQPSSNAKRLLFTNNDMRVLDGPFAESKELIGGFAVLELSGMDEVLAIAKPYTKILGGNLEIDVRVVDLEEDAE